MSEYIICSRCTPGEGSHLAFICDLCENDVCVQCDGMDTIKQCEMCQKMTCQDCYCDYCNTHIGIWMCKDCCGLQQINTDGS
jgi:hypothetical protein